MSDVTRHFIRKHYVSGPVDDPMRDGPVDDTLRQRMSSQEFVHGWFSSTVQRIEVIEVTERVVISTENKGA